jgi:DNA-binding GntR family transcriptional regulator
LTEVQLKPIEELDGTLAQRVYLSLQEAILTLKYPPGTVLKKGAICEQLGVSRSPVAEAIARLSAERLVDVIPQSATRVSGFSMEEIREACFLREAIELAAVGKVAEDRTEEQLTLLTREIRMQKLMIEDGDQDGFYKADEAFHALLMEFTRYPGVSNMAKNIDLRLSRARMLLLPEEGRVAAAAQEHARILSAIKQGNASLAQTEMKEHLAQLLLRLEPLETKHPDFFRSK